MEYIQKIIVSGILYVKEDGVMLAKRPVTKKIAPGKYHLPGGHVEFNEEPSHALRREFREEFSLDVDIVKILRSFSYTIENIHTVGITYIVQAKKLPKQIIFDNEDTEELVWVKNRNELGKFLSEDDHDYKTLSEFF